MSDTAKDPRDRVTEQAFRVAPSLLNVPLATPQRRLLALLLDIFIANMLAKLLGSVLLFLVGLSFARSARRTRPKGPLGQLRRAALAFGAVIGFAGAWSSFDLSQALSPRSEKVEMDVETASAAQAEVMEALQLISPELAEEVRVEVGQALVETASAHEAKAEAEPNNESAPPTWNAKDLFVGLLETFGLTFGWLGFYFTIGLALGKGQTPGKRVLGLRVVRLDGRAIGRWDAFERFSGYSAGLATGLLGFLQIYWDHNRQAIHDKISSTVVIREGTRGGR